MVSIPNFFIIGAPKCGTTALAQYLSENPHVYFSPIKEPQYFSPDIPKRVNMGLKTYLKLFKGADPKVHKAIGEGSTHYLYSREAVPNILRFNPEAKFIVMLRNPLDMARACHSEGVFEGYENITNFQQAWRAQEERRGGRNIPFSCFQPESLQYGEWSKLGSQMERLLPQVKPERLKIILFEDFTAQTARIYSEVLEFLGLPPDGRQEFKRINENKRVLWPRVQPVLGILSQTVWNAKKLLGITGKLGLFQTLLTLNTRKESREPIDGKFLEELRDYFREDTRKLSRLLGRDLSHWGT